MKKIFLIAIILIGFACKKKTVTPEPTPDPVCVKSPDQFSGKYVSPNNDTIEVVYLHDNCPTNKSNTFNVKKIGEAVQSIIKPSETFEIKDYEIVVDGVTNFGTHSNYFSLSRDSNGNLIFSSYKAYYTLKFTKI
jgi:hypothetical protein